jgi:group II intron reverse transcriptase/maturase
MNTPKSKPFVISKEVVWQAYLRVKANQGAAGVDGESIEEFERDLKGNLYKLWNRMSSGSYMPPPVRMVAILKPDGRGVRVLGVPTVADRIAQTVVALYLEPKVEPFFHPNSYGYRPGRSALHAVGVCRERCWQQDWVIDLDLKAFFDTLDHELTLRAVRHHTDQRWILLYVERWLTAPLQQEGGTLVARDRGSPQGSAVSPLLANLFLHYAFDAWMQRKLPTIQFERYVDDIVVHCKNERQARDVLRLITERLTQCRLAVNPEKTHIVYCKDGRRPGSYETERFDFLGYTFRPRRVRRREPGALPFVGFCPAVSDAARTAISRTIRRWRLHLRSGSTLEVMARQINPIVRGWINYYGRYYPSMLFSVLDRINVYLVRWARRKFKRLRTRPWATWRLMTRIARSEPRLFAHWSLGVQPRAG